MFNVGPKRLLREAGDVFCFHRTTVWHFLQSKLKLFPYRLHVEQQLSETEKKNSVAFSQLCKNLQKSPNFLKRTLFSDECSFTLQRAMKKKTAGPEVFKIQKTIRKSRQSSATLAVCCSVSGNEVIRPYY